MLSDALKGWRKTSLGSVVDFINGYAFKPEDWCDAGIPIIRIQNLNGSDGFNYFDGTIPERYHVRAGDLLFCWSGSRGTSFGARKWTGPLGYLNQHIFRCEMSRDLDDEFAFFLLEGMTGAIEAEAHGGGGLVHIKKSEIVKFDTLLPPLDEQRRIAEVLRAVDDAIVATIAGNKQAQSTLDSARATFLKPVADATALGEVCDVIGGYAFKSTSFIESGVKVLRISNITESGVDFSGRAVCVSQEDVRGLDRFRLKPLDTVVALSGATTGKMCVFSSDDTVYANQRVAVIRVRTGLADQAYINHALSLLTASVRQSAYGGAQPNISTKEIAVMEIALPSLPEQREIAEVLDALSQAVALGEQALSAHQATKAVLSSDLLSGHVRVPA